MIAILYKLPPHKGKGKMGLLDDLRTVPNAQDPKFANWDIENYMMMSWFINSMEPDISQGHLFSTVKEISEAAMLTYSNKGNDAQLYELKGRILDAKQGIRQ